MAAKGQKIKEALRPLVESLREGMGQNLIALVLFGSRARGEQRWGSDWDIFVLARSLPVSPMKRYAGLRSLRNEEPDGGVSFLAKTQMEFEEGFPSFYPDLALDGVILHDTDGYMEAKLRRIREIIKETGLKRERIPGGFFGIGRNIRGGIGKLAGRGLRWGYREYAAVGRGRGAKRVTMMSKAMGSGPSILSIFLNNLSEAAPYALRSYSPS